MAHSQVRSGGVPSPLQDNDVVGRLEELACRDAPARGEQPLDLRKPAYRRAHKADADDQCAEAVKIEECPLEPTALPSVIAPYKSDSNDNEPQTHQSERRGRVDSSWRHEHVNHGLNDATRWSTESMTLEVIDLRRARPADSAWASGGSKFKTWPAEPARANCCSTAKHNFAPAATAQFCLGRPTSAPAPTVAPMPATTTIALRPERRLWNTRREQLLTSLSRRSPPSA
jgi:hypothetical protein